MNTVEQPATGILKQDSFGDSIWYYVPCDCTDPDHSHSINVEADEYSSVSVYIYTKVKTKFWSKNRMRQLWDILTKGYAELEVSVILTEQQAVNYANALTSAVNDVKVFKQQKSKTT
jgi:hypothetical protein